MCVEHDRSICHRDVILEALRTDREATLAIEDLGHS
jgi:hypothetical protein